jgi:hypothetical protein
MNSHTQKVASVGFAGLAIFSAVVLFFPLAYQILPEVLQQSNAFQLAYVLVAACWMLAVVLATLCAMNDTDDKLCREYCDSLPESGDGDDEDDGDEGEGDGDDKDEEGGDDDDVELENNDASERGVVTWKDPTTGEIREIRTADIIPGTTGEFAVHPSTPDSGFVRADSINPSLNQPRIQVFRVPGGTLKPGM